MTTPQDKAAATRFVTELRTYMYPDGGHRSAPEREGVLHGKDIDHYDAMARKLYAKLRAMSTKERKHWMAQAFPLPKPYDELAEEEQAAARSWDWLVNPGGPFTEVNGILVTEQREPWLMWDWTNPRTGNQFRLRYALKDRLYLYVKHGGTYYWASGSPIGIPCSDHPRETAHDFIAGKVNP